MSEAALYSIRPVSFLHPFQWNPPRFGHNFRKLSSLNIIKPEDQTTYLFRMYASLLPFNVPFLLGILAIYTAKA